ncbi:MAG: DUF72 domain-containing protein [Deltaproteobacteria bacterium]|nr:DUF72 domain-containing protein [Deltaproteobacteria bacterium]
MKIHTGVSTFPKYLKKIKQVCDVAELESFFNTKPRKSTLENWRNTMGKKFRFVIPAPLALTDPTWKKDTATFWREGAQGFAPGSETDFIGKTLWKSAGLLQSITFLFVTPPSFRPTADNRDRIMDFFQPFLQKNQRIIWEPQGLWDIEGLLKKTSNTGITISQNPLSDDFIQTDEDFRYFRIESHASANVIREDNIERILDACEGSKRSFVIFKTSMPLRDASIFSTYL